MADSLFNLNTGDSNSSYSSAQYAKQASVEAATVNTDYQHGWLRTPQPFGLNVRVPSGKELVGENTEALIKKTAKDLIMAPLKEITDFFAKYETVFNGDTATELKSLYVQQFNTVALLNNEDEEYLGASKPTFVMDM